MWNILISHLPRHEVTSGVDFSAERLVCLCQHLFDLLIVELREVIGSDGRYSLTLENVGGSRRLHLSYWRGSQLQTILLMDCDRSGGGRYLDVLTVSSFVCIPAFVFFSCQLPWGEGGSRQSSGQLSKPEIRSSVAAHY